MKQELNWLNRTKLTKQVRHYEQLVAVMKQDHEKDLDILYKETAETRLSLTR